MVDNTGIPIAENQLKPVRQDFLNFGKPKIEEAEIEEVVASLREGWLVTGPKVARFEQMFKDYIGSQHAVALNSCTAGLHLSLLVAGVGPGDEVITTPFTFAATANSIVHVGARPVFVDIDPQTLTIDPAKIEAAVTAKTKAILPVHYGGRPCEMNAVMEIARRNNLIVIEDAAHAIEAEYQGRKIGSIGDLTCFSFYVTKNLITGEGGMVTTANGDWAEKIRILALHGLSKDAWKRYSAEGDTAYKVMYPGFKYNMMDLQAALGIHQLPRAERYLEWREEIWRRYDEAFADQPLATPVPVPQDVKHARHLYTVLIDSEHSGISRDVFKQALAKQNIGSAVHFPSLHLQPYYADTYGYKPGDFPNTEFIADRIISLPLSANLTDQDVDDVIEAVRSTLIWARGRGGLTALSSKA